jgi:hypothetical protein
MMKRVGIGFCGGVAAAGLVLGMAGFSAAAEPDTGKTVAPISSATPDIVAVDPPNASGGNAVAAPKKFRRVSPSIIAEIDPAPEAAQKPDENGKKKRFDPAPLVIRAGMVGNAAPIKASDPRPAHPKVAPDGHMTSPENGDKPAETDQKKPPTTPE